MSRPLLVLTVALAGYAVISSLLAAAVAAFWRRRGTNVHSASTLALLRLLPAGFGALATAVIVVPAFLVYEPVRESEPVGPIVIALALVALGVASAAAAIAVRTLLQTVRLERRWLRSAARIPADPSAAMATYVIDSATPLVALIGVFSPRLVAARSVVEACSREEFAVIVAHERGHLRARDNLVRWLLCSVPDTLRWSSCHRDILNAWRHASEDAADDAAARNDAGRAELAALLVKVARLGVTGPAPATVSPFADPDGLERRVRRLIAASGPAPANRWPRGAMMLAAALAAALLSRPAVLLEAYEIIEFTVRAGR
jgi:beta-lactamase regulating signal transducer with metallopeptidase domain